MKGTSFKIICSEVQCSAVQCSAVIVDADAKEELVIVSLSKKLWAQELMLFIHALMALSKNQVQAQAQVQVYVSCSLSPGSLCPSLFMAILTQLSVHVKATKKQLEIMTMSGAYRCLQQRLAGASALRQYQSQEPPLLQPAAGAGYDSNCHYGCSCSWLLPLLDAA